MLLRLFLLKLLLIQFGSCTIFSMNEFIIGKRRNSNLLKFPFFIENDKAISKRDLTGTEAILYNNDAYRYSVPVQIGGDTNNMFMNTANYIGWSTENNHDLSIEPNFFLSDKTYAAYDISTGNSPSGSVMKGTVVFSGISSNVTINNVPLADLSDSNISEQLALGLGLNPNTLSNDFIDAIYSQGLIDSKTFSLFLHNIDLNGDIIFGGVDNSLHSGVIKYVNVDTSTVQSSSHGGWYITLENVKDIYGDYISSISYIASIDTSTYYSYLPHAIASEMASQLGATEKDGYYSSPCDSLYVDPKNFTLSFDNDIEITVSSSQLFYKEDQNGQCDLLFADSSDDSVILGQSLLTSSYLVFDVANKRVGIAQVDTEDSNYTTCDICESVSIICSSCYNVTTSSTKLITSTISTTILTSTVITHTYSTTSSSSSPESSISLISSSCTLPETAFSLITSSSSLSSLIPPSFQNSSSTSFFTPSSSFIPSSYGLSVSSATPNCGNTYYTTFSTLLSSTSTGSDGHISTEITTFSYSILATYSCLISSLSSQLSTTHSLSSIFSSSSSVPSLLTSSSLTLPSLTLFSLTPSSLTSSSSTPSSLTSSSSTPSSLYMVPSVLSSILPSTTSISSTSSLDTPAPPSTVYLDSSTCSRPVQVSTSSLISVTSSTPLICNDLYYKPSILFLTSTFTINESTQRIIYSQTVSYLTSVYCSDSFPSSSVTLSSPPILSAITSSTSYTTPLTCGQPHSKLTTTISTGLSNLAVTTSSYDILTTYECPSPISPKSSLSSLFTSATIINPATSVKSISLVTSSSTSSFILSPSLSSNHDSYTPITSFPSTTSGSHFSCDQIYYTSKISTITSTITDDNEVIKTSSMLSTFNVLTTFNCASSLSVSSSTILSFLKSSSVPVSSTESTTTIITTHCNAPRSYTGSFNCSLASISSSLSVPVQISTSTGLSSHMNFNTKSSISSFPSPLSLYENSFNSSLSYQPVSPETSDDLPSLSMTTLSTYITPSIISFSSSPLDSFSSILIISASNAISSSVPIGNTPTRLTINRSTTTFTASSPIVSIYEGSANSVIIGVKSIVLLTSSTFLLITFALILI